MGRFLSYLREHKRESLLAPFFKMLEAIFDLLIPLIMADIINRGIGGGDRGLILRQCLLMVALGLVGLACSITAQWFAAKASVESCSRVRQRLFEKVQTLGFKELDTLGGSTLITRMTSDINQVQNGLNLFLRLFLRSPFVVFGAALLAFTVNVRGALVFAVAIPLLSVIVFTIMLRTAPKYAAVQKLLDGLTALTRENLTGVRVVRAFGREAEETQRFEAADAGLLRSQLRVGNVAALMNPLTYAVINLSILVLLQVGGAQVNTGVIAMGDVVALVNYMGQILVELVKLANLIIQIAKASACAGRIQGILDLQPEMHFGGQQPDTAAEEAVVFDHVSLTYNEGAAASLSDISFSVKKGETVGVIGSTGAGKTSLVHLIPRYYDATAGEVRVFGQNVKNYAGLPLRRSVGVVLQKPQLFSGTLRSNLRWGSGREDEALFREALAMAQATDIPAQRPEGLDAPVEQGGRNFSGGQRQRLSLARTLAARPAILILDDASSALDYATDAALRRALTKLPKDTTVFLVSQRANSLRHADRILVLEEGRLVGNAPHSELLKSCPVYREIYESQFGEEEEA